MNDRSPPRSRVCEPDEVRAARRTAPLARVACAAMAVASMITAGVVVGSREPDASGESTNQSTLFQRTSAARATEDAVTAARLQPAAMRRAQSWSMETAITGTSLTGDFSLAQLAAAAHSATPSPTPFVTIDSQPNDIVARLLGPFGRVEWTPPQRVDEPPAIGSAADIRWYNGRPIRPVRIERMRVTAYSPDERSCGDSADGITASGYSVSTNGGFLVAADPKVLPLGSLVSVPGYDFGEVVPVLDVGGAIKGARLDVLFPTHEEAVRWGVRALDVTIWEYADGKPNGFKRFRRPAKRTP